MTLVSVVWLSVLLALSEAVQNGSGAVQYGGKAVQYGGKSLQYGGKAVQYGGKAVQYGGEAVQNGGEAVQNGGEAVSADKTRAAARRFVHIEAVSGRNMSSVKVQGRYVHYAECHVPARDAGLYLVIVHQSTGQLMARRYAPGLYEAGLNDMQQYLQRVQRGRIIVLVAMYDIFPAIEPSTRQFFGSLGHQFKRIKSGSAYALIASKTVRTWSEATGPSGSPLTVSTKIRLIQEDRCQWSIESDEQQQRIVNRKRSRFCNRYEGYGGLCNCTNPDTIDYTFRPLLDGVKFQVPIAILTSDRTPYLYRTLQSLLPLRGLNKSLVTIYTQTNSRELVDLANLLGIRVHYSEPGSSSLSGRISVNLKNAILHSFSRFPSADKIIILEDDLQVSPDFISYFSQTAHLLDEDDTLYCVSAWNDLSYRHSAYNNTLLYRTSYFPGLGWMMKRSILMNEMIPRWKKSWEDWDWDMWFRSDDMMLGRECVVPDVPRTYHFGWQGRHVYSGLQFEYYSDKAFNSQPDVTLSDVSSLLYPNYRDLILNLASGARLPNMNVYFRTCPDIFPETANITERMRPYILAFSMKHAFDQKGIQNLLTCLGVWDMDIRGGHHGVWRMFINKNPIVLIGIPYSYYGHAFLQSLGTSPLFDFGPFKMKRGRRPATDGKSPPQVVRFSTPDDDEYDDTWQ